MSRTNIARKMVAEHGVKAHWTFDGTQTLCGRGFRTALQVIDRTSADAEFVLCKSCASGMKRLSGYAETLAHEENATWFVVDFSGLPDELCAHGIAANRHCSICEEEQPAYAAQVAKVREMRSRVFDGLREKAIRSDEDREIYRWVTNIEPGTVTDWAAVSEYAERRQHFTPEEWSNIAVKAADHNLIGSR